MRLDLFLLFALCAALAAAAPARAQTGPVIVVPGKPGVPVIINGMIVDYDVIYGDWGLARPGHGEIVIEGPVVYANPDDQRGYYPATGRRPRVGRLEIEPPRRARVDTNFHREWFVGSDLRKPVTDYPPIDPPPVILAPRNGRR